MSRNLHKLLVKLQLLEANLQKTHQQVAKKKWYLGWNVAKRLGRNIAKGSKSKDAKIGKNMKTQIVKDPRP